MPKAKPDVAVLGAGPAGSIVARQLGLAGVDVILIDPGPFGGGHAVETLPPSAAPLAEDIGLLAAIYEVSDGPAAQMQMLWRDEPETRLFEGDGPLILRRKALHEMLRDEALLCTRSLSARVRKIRTTQTGAEIETDAGDVSCQMVIDARGRSAAKRHSSDLVALPFSAQGDLPHHAMWLAALPTGWIWASTLDTDDIHGVLFHQASVLAGMSVQSRLAHAQHCLAASDVFKGVSEMEVGTPAAAGLSAVEDPVLSDRYILIGDAALARDPIASHGLVHAMRSGVQAAIAVRTILDPAGDSHAARCFLRHKHAEAVTAARRATGHAYLDQCRHQTPFWTQHFHDIKTAPSPQFGPGPVALFNPLTRAPVLDHDQIRWVPAIELPATRDFFTRLGPVTALDIATACRPKAPLQDIATRLGRVHAMPVVFDVLEHLTLGGAFVQAPCPA